MRINGIGKTDETLTGRGGLLFFVRYLTNIGIFRLLTEHFGDLRKSRKGLPVADLFKQIFCFFCDGTSRHLTYFDELAGDAGYAGTIEQSPETMASSHAIKRFFRSFSIFKVWVFRKILRKLFIWRLRIAKPDVIRIDIDTMVMNNNDADARQGVGPTYKKIRGFQPFQVTWGRFVIDAVFRGGICHSNHGETVARTVTILVNLIRREYRDDAVILLTCDCGFFDQKLFNTFEKLGIYYVSAARMTEDAKTLISSLPETDFRELRKEEQTWQFAEFGFCCDAWDTFRRFIFCRPLYENEQMLLTFERPDTLLVTNLRPDTPAESAPDEIRHLTIISAYHMRGASELIFRALEDFGTEQMPFKRFVPNAAFYYMMLIAFFLFETFKEDALSPIIPLQSYAGTVRRLFTDIAGKIVSHSGRVILKFTTAVFRRLQLEKVWEACHSPPSLF